MLTINWTEPVVPNGVIAHYTVFYLPVRGPYGAIMTLTNLNGLVRYRIQVSAVALYNGDNLFGDRSTPDFVTTLEGSEFNIIIILLLNTASCSTVVYRISGIIKNWTF